MIALLRMISSTPNPKIFSGSIVDVRSGTLSDFALKLVDVIPNAEIEDVQHLQNLAVLDADRRYSANWQNEDPKGIVRTIAEATRGSGQQNKNAVA
jgi:hypothetical protein